MTTRQRDRRPGYFPQVRSRGIRENGLLPLSPARSKDTSDIKSKWYTQAVSATRATMVTPATGKRIRLTFLRLINIPNATATITNEFYFGTAADISAADRPIDAFQLTGVGEQTRTWTRGQGPLGNKDEVLSIRQNSTAAGGNVNMVIEYTEER